MSMLCLPRLGKDSQALLILVVLSARIVPLFRVRMGLCVCECVCACVCAHVCVYMAAKSVVLPTAAPAPATCACVSVSIITPSTQVATLGSFESFGYL